jgi:hypothetical protein
MGGFIPKYVIVFYMVHPIAFFVATGNFILNRVIVFTLGHPIAFFVATG